MSVRCRCTGPVFAVPLRQQREGDPNYREQEREALRVLYPKTGNVKGPTQAERVDRALKRMARVYERQIEGVCADFIFGGVAQ